MRNARAITLQQGEYQDDLHAFAKEEEALERQLRTVRRMIASTELMLREITKDA